MAKYKVDKVEGKWSVVETSTNKVVETDIRTRDIARQRKKALEGNGTVVEKVKAKPAKPAKAAKPQKAKRQKVVREPVSEVQVNHGTKVEGISKANYKGNLARAEELKKRLVAHYEKTGGFPSHRAIIRDWGFNICLKSIIRHKRKLMEKLGKDNIPTTSELPRKKAE